jgi:hypothetical protein
MAETLTAANGMPGTRRTVVEFDGTAVVIRRGLLGSGVTTIPVSRITSVGWKRTLAGSGWIEFTAAGMDGRVTFNTWSVRKFEAMRAAVEAALQ